MVLTAPGEAAEPFSIEALYRESRDDVFAYVMGMLGDRGDAEEVTAAAFERAFRRRHLFRVQRGSPRAWLFGIARNAALDELRGRRRSGALPVEDPPDAAGEGRLEEAAELSFRRQAVARAMRGLDPRERELIALKFFAGLSNQEIARVLRTSESNAGTRLHRALAKVREACDA